MSISDQKSLEEFKRILKQNKQKRLSGNFTDKDMEHPQQFIKRQYRELDSLKFSDEFLKNGVHGNFHMLCSDLMVPGGLTNLQIMFLASLNAVKRHIQEKFSQTQNDLRVIWSAIPEELKKEWDKCFARSWAGFESLAQTEDSWGRTDQEFQVCVSEIISILTDLDKKHDEFLDKLRENLRS
jgi:hypothetical protein